MQIGVIFLFLIIIGCDIWMELGVLSLSEILCINPICNRVEGELEEGEGCLMFHFRPQAQPWDFVECNLEQLISHSVSRIIIEHTTHEMILSNNTFPNIESNYAKGVLFFHFAFNPCFDIKQKNLPLVLTSLFHAKLFFKTEKSSDQSKQCATASSQNLITLFCF